MNLAVTLRDAWMTEEAMLKHLEALGDIYSKHWCYYRQRVISFHLVLIDAVSTVPYGLARELGYPSDRIEIHARATLSRGQQDLSYHGFEAHLLTQINFPEIHDIDHFVGWRLIKSYPCAHVTVPDGWRF